jgi:hypothetical protein
MKYLFLLLIFTSSVVYAEPKNTKQDSPKLCLETIYKKNFESAPEGVSKKLNHLLSKCIAETKIKDFTLVNCSCSHPKDIDPCIDKFISSHNFTRVGYYHSVAYHCERMVWSGFVSEK